MQNERFRKPTRNHPSRGGRAFDFRTVPEPCSSRELPPTLARRHTPECAAPATTSSSCPLNSTGQDLENLWTTRFRPSGRERRHQRCFDERRAILYGIRERRDRGGPFRGCAKQGRSPLPPRRISSSIGRERGARLRTIARATAPSLPVQLALAPLPSVVVMKVEDKRKPEVLLALQASARGRFEARRVIEWRMNFGVWTALLVISAGMASSEYSIPYWGRACVAVAAILIVLLHGYWSVRITDLLEKDRRLAMSWGMQVEAMMSPSAEPSAADTEPRGSTHEPKATASRRWPMDWGTGVAWGVTLLLAMMTVLAALAGGHELKQPEESGLTFSFTIRRFW